MSTEAMDKSLQARIHAELEKEPEGRAITFYEDDGSYSWYTREQFLTWATGYAAWLADNGLGQGDVCILVLPSDKVSTLVLVGALLLGAVPLLVAPPVLQAKGAFSSLTQILHRIIGKTKPRVVVCPDSLTHLQEELEKGGRGARFLFGTGDVSSDASVALPTIVPCGTDVAAMQLTSGTTGFPRVCVWRQENVTAALDGMVTAMKLSREDVCLNWTPLYHDMGLVNNFFLCFTSGVPLVMMRPTDFVRTPALWLRGLFETGATVTWSPNFGFAITAQRVRDSEIEGVRLDGVRAFWNAAERIHYETVRAFHERFAPVGVRLDALKTNYGCAENVGGATFSDPDGMFIVEHLDRTFLQEEGIAQPVGDVGDDHSVPVVGVGRPHPGIRIEILSRTGRALPDGHIGEIALDTPSRLDGYLGDARATRRAIYGDLLRTGDMGYMRGEQLFWTGRVRDRITVRGVKLDPSDLEPVLLKVPGLRHGSFAAFGVDDEEQGTQRIVVVAEVRDTTSRPPKEISGDIRSQVLKRLGVNISEVILVRKGTLTKTSSGKRRHRYFHHLYLEGELDDYEWQPQETAG